MTGISMLPHTLLRTGVVDGRTSLLYHTHCFGQVLYSATHIVLDRCCTLLHTLFWTGVVDDRNLYSAIHTVLDRCCR